MLESHLIYVANYSKAERESYPLGVDILFLLFPPYAVRMLCFRSFEGKVFILSLPNLVWVFIGLIACMGLLLVKIAV